MICYSLILFHRNASKYEIKKIRFDTTFIKSMLQILRVKIGIVKLLKIPKMYLEMILKPCIKNKFSNFFLALEYKKYTENID